MKPRWLLLSLVALTVGGCAFQNPKNTPILTALDEQVTPESTSAKVAYGIFWVPAGVACGLTDLLVAHPVQATVPAARRTGGAVWSTDGQSFVERSLLFLPRVAATPVVFTATWLFHCAFDMPPPAAPSPAPPPADQEGLES
jgi:hypothetical protein